MSTVTDTQVGKHRDSTPDNNNDNVAKLTGDKLLEAAGTLVGGPIEIDLKTGTKAVFDKHVKSGAFPDCTCDRLGNIAIAATVMDSQFSPHIAQMTDNTFFGSIDSGEGLNKQRQRDAQAAADAAAKSADESGDKNLMGYTVQDRQKV
jgi:hypothetical protein